MPFQGVKIFYGTYTRSGSTMINIPWHVKIDAQDLFYFMILPVGETLIDLAVSMKLSLQLYTDAHGTLILTTTMNALPRTMREPIVWRWGTIGFNTKLQMLLLHWEVIMKNKTKWEFSALVSSRSLDELPWKARITWHHDVDITLVKGLRSTQCHQEDLW